MTITLIVLGLGLAAGLVIGFVLGMESPRKCAGCLSDGGAQYAEGYDAGCRWGAEWLRDRLMERHMAPGGWVKLTKAELEREFREMTDIYR